MGFGPAADNCRGAADAQGPCARQECDASEQPLWLALSSEGKQFNRRKDLEFRKLEGGKYFPPILPNGEFFSLVPQAGRAMRIFSVTAEGLFAEGIHLLWSEIEGASFVGTTCRINSQKYSSAGFSFNVEACMIQYESGLKSDFVQGYPVGYCLLNRITFEAQRMRFA